MSQVAGQADPLGSLIRTVVLAAVAWGLTIAPLSAQGTSGKIQGTVYDQSGAPIANAQVFIVNTTFGTTTNADGFYFINSVLVGTVTLQASFIGYKAARVEGIKVLSGQTLTQDVTLEATPFEVEEITVIAAINPLVPRDEVTTKQRVDGTYAQELPIDRVSAVLALQPGVAASADGRTLFIRGGRADEAVLYLDGVPAQSGTRNDIGSAGSSGIVNLSFTPGVNSVSTVGFAEASITTGAAAAEFGNSQSGVIAVQTRTGGSAWTGSLSYETNNFGSGTYGLNRMTGSLSGPILDNLTFFLGGDLEGRKSFEPGKGRIDNPIMVQAGRDTVLEVPSAVGDPVADTTRVEIQRWAIYTGNCDQFAGSSNPDIAANYGSECQGVRVPYTPQSEIRLNSNVNWSYGTGSRLRFGATFNQRQQRYSSFFNNNGLFSNPTEAVAFTGSNAIYTLNWTQNLARSAERALALEIGLSYQQDRFIRSALTRSSESESYAPFGGFLIKPLGYVFDRDQFPVNQKLVDNIRDGVPNSRRSPYDLQNGQGYLTVGQFRTNPYGLASLWSENGGPEFIRHRVNDENRWVGRGTLDWQADRFNRVKLGGEYTAYDIHSYDGSIRFPGYAYIEQPVRWSGFLQDRIDLGDVVVEGGLRYDYFRSGAERTYLLDLTPDSPTVNQYVFLPHSTGYRGTSDPGEGPADCADTGCPLTIFRPDESHDYLSPHIQVAFPVTRSTNFRLSYAHQVQTPDFALVLDLWGTDLDFGKTITFEFGIRHSFSADAVLDVSAYNKDNLANTTARQLTLFDPSTSLPSPQTLITNADFGNVKGIDIRYDRRFGNLFNGTLAYTFEDAQSTGSDPFSALMLGRANIDQTSGQGLPPPQAILPTTQSRPHTLAGSFGLTFPNDWKAGTGVGWLENVGLFTTFRFASGTAFTRCPNNSDNAFRFSGQGCFRGEIEGDLNGARLPMLKEFNMRVTKGFGLGGVDVTAYVDARNLFNFTNTLVVYSSTNDVRNDEAVEQTWQNDFREFEGEAMANGSWTAEEAIALPAANGGCHDWIDQANLPASPSCFYLIRAEQRYGNGDRVFSSDEQRAASEANFYYRRGLDSFTGPGRDVRLGLELNF
jgi:hypothetical protein